jgi:N-acylglucosamine-6-phosphate 2-epimerase
MNVNTTPGKTAMPQQLVVSCQPLPGSAMDQPEIILAMALAAVDGGAQALRIEGVANVRRVIQHVSVPVIGIVKRDLPDSEIRITPWLEDVDALVDAGASIVAFDATLRPRPVTVEALIARIHAQGCLAMADCSDVIDGLIAWSLGADLVGTTMSGYTAPSASDDPSPDIELIRALVGHGCRVVAEGRIRTPQQAAAAMAAGASCVTVGSAITRIEHITGWFRDAMQERAAP